MALADTGCYRYRWEIGVDAEVDIDCWGYSFGDIGHAEEVAIEGHHKEAAAAVQGVGIVVENCKILVATAGIVPRCY